MSLPTGTPRPFAVSPKQNAGESMLGDVDTLLDRIKESTTQAHYLIASTAADLFGFELSSSFIGKIGRLVKLYGYQRVVPALFNYAGIRESSAGEDEVVRYINGFCSQQILTELKDSVVLPVLKPPKRERRLKRIVDRRPFDE